MCLEDIVQQIKLLRAEQTLLDSDAQRYWELEKSLEYLRNMLLKSQEKRDN